MVMLWKAVALNSEQYLTALFTDGKQYDISDLHSVIPDLAP